MTELAMDERQMFDPLSTVSMTETLDHALDAPAWLADAGERAKAWVAGRSWDQVARAVADVYREVLAR